MAIIVNPPSFDEGTGRYVGDFQIQHRDLSRGQLTVDDASAVDPNEFNDALDPYLAEQAVKAQLPVFDPNASDDAIINFWRSKRPLTDSELSALTAAYAATDNEAIANLVQYRITGDESVLSEQQRWELGLDDDQNSYEETDGADEPQGFSDEQLEAVEDYISANATEPSQEAAQAILNANLGDSDEAAVIQYLAYAYYNGEKSLEDAYNEALESGLPHDKLYAVFTKLINQTQK